MEKLLSLSRGVPSQESVVLVSRVRVLFAAVLDGLAGVLKVMCKDSAMGGKTMVDVGSSGDAGVTH